MQTELHPPLCYCGLVGILGVRFTCNNRNWIWFCLHVCCVKCCSVAADIQIFQYWESWLVTLAVWLIVGMLDRLFSVLHGWLVDALCMKAVPVDFLSNVSVLWH